MIVNRRAFLRRSISAALGGTALYSALGNLKVMAAAANLSGTPVPGDYRALVCVYLDGGNDSFNTLVPYSAPHYGVYQSARPALALAQGQVQAQVLTPQPLQGGLPGGPPSDGASYGLHPATADPSGDLRWLFNNQRAAVVSNVGTLLGPITKAQYQQNPALAPPQLFSHSDQTTFWHTSRPDDNNADGWGGRIADLLHSANPGTHLPMSMSLGALSRFQRGSVVDQYVIRACAGNYCAAETIEYLGAYQNELGTQTFEALIAQGTQSHLFERAYADSMRRSIASYRRLNQVLNPLPVWNTPFPNTRLGGQLRQVANLINARNVLDMRRQIFYVQLGPFDTHDDQLQTHAGLLSDLSRSLHAFYQATVQMGVAEGVTAFTASDFGRTISTNGDGTDHGWGGHHFVVGGAVRGGRFYGRMNSLSATANPDDAGYGQVIPTTGVDQYAATLASWFGVANADLGLLFPRLGEYDTANLGFMGT